MLSFGLDVKIMGLILVTMAVMIILLGILFIGWGIRHIRTYDYKSKLMGGCTIAMGSFMITVALYGLYLFRVEIM